MSHERVLNALLVAAVIGIALAALGVPLLAYAPLLILLACPLMMFFMMRSMSNGGPADRSTPPAPGEDSQQIPTQELPRSQ